MLDQAGGFRKLLQRIREKGLDVEKEMQEVLTREAPLFNRVGMKIDSIKDGTVQISFRYNEEIGRVGKMVHGGIGMYVLDTAAGIAVMTRNDGIDQLTLELKVNFLEPMRKSPFRAIGRVVRAGRTTAVAEAELIDSDEQICAKALGTWYLISSGAGRKTRSSK